MTPDPVAAELAAAWETFREAVNPPAHLAICEHFTAVVRPLIVAARSADASRTVAPYVHGDPRVDRWQVVTSGDYPPAPDRPAPDGFEPLAAWSVMWPAHGIGFVWERPLRHCDVAPATEESALAALLTAWDAWPEGTGHRHGDLLAGLTSSLRHAGMADDSGRLTEAARAIVARAGERGQP